METKERALKSILNDLENKELTKHQAYDLIFVLFDDSEPSLKIPDIRNKLTPLTHLISMVELLTKYANEQTNKQANEQLQNILNDQLNEIENDIDRTWQMLQHESQYQNMDGITPFLLQINKLNLSLGKLLKRPENFNPKRW